MAKVQKVYTENSKSRQCGWPRPAASRLGPGSQRAGHLRRGNSPMAQGTDSARQRSLSRQRTPNTIRRGKSPPQTRARKSAAGARYIKKSCGHLFTGIQMKYQFIAQHKQEFPVVVMCRVLSVSESGFYAWRKRPPCQRKREDAQLSEEIRQEVSHSSWQIGSPRLHAELRRSGTKHLPANGWPD